MKAAMYMSKRVIFSLILIGTFAFSTPAFAADFSNLSSGLTDLLSILNQSPFIIKIKSDFCNTYTSSSATGEWKEGELRTNLGVSICTGFTPTPADPITNQSPFILPKISIAPISLPNIVFPSITFPTTGIDFSGTTTIKVPKLNTSDILETPVQNNAQSGGLLNETDIIKLTNSQRAQNDATLVTLTHNSVLSKVASERVDDMFAKQYFEHVSPSGDNVTKVALRDGYAYITIGENIALGNFASSNALVIAWMNSPGHRANIMNKNYTEIGVSAKQGMYEGNTVWIAAQIFGKPLANCKAADVTLKQKITAEQSSATALNTQLESIRAQLTTLATTDAAAYNAKLPEYNAIAKQYNTLVADMKSLTTTYNQEVAAFNLCIKTT